MRKFITQFMIVFTKKKQNVFNIVAHYLLNSTRGRRTHGVWKFHLVAPFWCHVLQECIFLHILFHHWIFSEENRKLKIFRAGKIFQGGNKKKTKFFSVIFSIFIISLLIKYNHIRVNDFVVFWCTLLKRKTWSERGICITIIFLFFSSPAHFLSCNFVSSDPLLLPMGVISVA